jgi:hypothetical protein
MGQKRCVKDMGIIARRKVISRKTWSYVKDNIKIYLKKISYESWTGITCLNIEASKELR